MKYKIGVFGSSAGLESFANKSAMELGEALAKQDVTIITGACLGIPYMVAEEAAKAGIKVWGYAPTVDKISLQEDSSEQNLDIYEKLFYIAKDFEFIKNINVCRKFRNVTSTSHCDAGIIVSGRWGTMNEFTNLYDMGKVIGVLTKTGGVADEIVKLSKKISKASKAKIIFNSSPEKLVKLVIKELENR
jgi:predicted Rossmann-fold nucleotide-binding protein